MYWHVFAVATGVLLVKQSNHYNIRPITIKSQISALRDPAIAQRRGALAVIPATSSVAAQDSFGAALADS